MTNSHSPFGSQPGGYGSGGSGYGASGSGGFGSPQPGGYGAPGGGFGSQPGGYGAPSGGSPFGGAPAPQPYGQPGAYGGGPTQAVAPTPGQQPRKRGFLGLAIGIPAALVVGGVIGFLIGNVGIGTLPSGEVETQVTAVLQTDFGLTELAGVDCPDRIANDQGDSFQCTFEYSGQQQSVTVTIGSGDGQLVVGAPE